MAKKKHEDVATIRPPNEKAVNNARTRRWNTLGLDKDAVFSYLVDLSKESGTDPNSKIWETHVETIAYVIALLTIGRGRNRNGRVPAHMLHILRDAAIALGSKATLQAVALRLREDLLKQFPSFRPRGRKSRWNPPGIINRVLFGRPNPRKVNQLAATIKANNPKLSDKIALLTALDHLALDNQHLEYYQRRFSDSKKK